MYIPSLAIQSGILISNIYIVILIGNIYIEGINKVNILRIL